MRGWVDEMMGRWVIEIMRKRDNERKGGQENRKMGSDFIQFVSFSTIVSLF
jgi:hypothetical protein